MRDIAVLIQNATDDELAVIKRVMQRAHEKPCVVVTMREGSKSRKYVVDQADECVFENGIPEGWGTFGARWVRSYGRVGEMHRSLSTTDVVKVSRADRRKVWGDR